MAFVGWYTVLYVILSRLVDTASHLGIAVDAYGRPTVNSLSDIRPEFDYTMCPALLDEPGIDTDVADLATGYKMSDYSWTPPVTDNTVKTVGSNVGQYLADSLKRRWANYMY